MTRRITLAIVTDESGTKCAPECPHVEATRTDLVCNAFGASLDDDERLPACIEAERHMTEGLLDMVPLTKLEATIAKRRGGK